MRQKVRAGQLAPSFFSCHNPFRISNCHKQPTMTAEQALVRKEHPPQSNVQFSGIVSSPRRPSPPPSQHFQGDRMDNPLRSSPPPQFQSTYMNQQMHAPTPPRMPYDRYYDYPPRYSPRYYYGAPPTFCDVSPESRRMPSSSVHGPYTAATSSPPVDSFRSGGCTCKKSRYV